MESTYEKYRDALIGKHLFRLDGLLRYDGVIENILEGVTGDYYQLICGNNVYEFPADRMDNLLTGDLARDAELKGCYFIKENFIESMDKSIAAYDKIYKETGV